RGIDEQRVGRARGIVIGDCARAEVEKVGPGAGGHDVVADDRVGGAAGEADADGRVRRVQGLVNGVVVEIRVARAEINGDAGRVIPNEVVVGEVSIADRDYKAGTRGRLASVVNLTVTDDVVPAIRSVAAAGLVDLDTFAAGVVGLDAVQKVVVACDVKAVVERIGIVAADDAVQEFVVVR